MRQSVDGTPPHNGLEIVEALNIDKSILAWTRANGSKNQDTEGCYCGEYHLRYEIQNNLRNRHNNHRRKFRCEHARKGSKRRTPKPCEGAEGDINYTIKEFIVEGECPTCSVERARSRRQQITRQKKRMDQEWERRIRLEGEIETEAHREERMRRASLQMEQNALLAQSRKRQATMREIHNELRDIQEEECSESEVPDSPNGAGGTSSG
ncbi:hypothetical protein SAMD00023353_1601810 [Rosellinia necatrix]|uniref:Uncharacterized protein n=1 Tax=Rosellinia necatrix TaxID=77044 RepID=A0A1W2TI55_ROSNE|nr:hypothetical protein SAMD00023353_1601810 [Rosellinia necatrix]